MNNQKYKFRVLMRDWVNGEEFNFAITVDADNRLTDKMLAQFGMTEAEGAAGSALGMAGIEFPGAYPIKAELWVDILRKISVPYND